GVMMIDRCQGNVTGDAATTAPTQAEFDAFEEPFGATLDVAASFGDTGSNGIPSAQSTIQTEALGLIQFESEHFGYEWRRCISHRPTFSFAGNIGFKPTLVLENLTSKTATIAIPSNRPMFQDAFGWALTPKVNVA